MHKDCVMNTLFNESKESLVGYYILPLVGMSYRAFGPYFKKAHIDREHSVVRVTMSRGCAEEYWNNNFFQVDYDEGENTYALYRIPEPYKDDVDLFAQGKYSQMSRGAKKTICNGSGLFYNKQIDNMVVTDKRLLALTGHPVLKQWVEETFEITKGKKSEYIKLKNKESIYYG